MIMNNELQIFLNEEYGYRTYNWKPGMTEEQFVSWWQNLSDSDIIKYYFNINTLPGTLTLIKTSPHGDAKTRMYNDPRDVRPTHYCHLHDVDDSFLEINDIKYPYKRTSRKDWKDYWLDYQLRNRKPEEVA